MERKAQAANSHAIRTTVNPNRTMRASANPESVNQTRIQASDNASLVLRNAVSMLSTVRLMVDSVKATPVRAPRSKDDLSARASLRFSPLPNGSPRSDVVGHRSVARSEYTDATRGPRLRRVHPGQRGMLTTQSHTCSVPTAADGAAGTPTLTVGTPYA